MRIIVPSVTLPDYDEDTEHSFEELQAHCVVVCRGIGFLSLFLMTLN